MSRYHPHYQPGLPPERLGGWPNRADISTGGRGWLAGRTPVPWAANGAQPSQPTQGIAGVDAVLCTNPPGAARSAGGSGVHSCFCAWRRLSPNPALWASLEAYYSPSQPLRFSIVLSRASIGCLGKGCQGTEAFRPGFSILFYGENYPLILSLSKDEPVVRQAHHERIIDIPADSRNAEWVIEIPAISTPPTPPAPKTGRWCFRCFPGRGGG